MAKNNKIISNLNCFIGNKIFQTRIAMGFSRQELSDAIDVTHQQLQKYEKGLNRVSAGRLLLISGALNRDIAYFFEGFEENKDQQTLGTSHQRMCLEITRNFLKITNESLQNTINNLIKMLSKKY